MFNPYLDIYYQVIDLRDVLYPLGLSHHDLCRANGHKTEDMKYTAIYCMFQDGRKIKCIVENTSEESKLIEAYTQRTGHHCKYDDEVRYFLNSLEYN